MPLYPCTIVNVRKNTISTGVIVSNIDVVCYEGDLIDIGMDYPPSYELRDSNCLIQQGYTLTIFLDFKRDIGTAYPPGLWRDIKTVLYKDRSVQSWAKGLDVIDYDLPYRYSLVTRPSQRIWHRHDPIRRKITKIQRWMRRMLNIRRRQVAFAMVLHKRLGQGSLWAQLPVELLKEILL